MKHILLSFLIIFTLFQATQAQQPDTVIRKGIIKQSILPVSLMAVGSILSDSNFEKNLQTNLRDAVENDYEFRIDNYLQYTPVAELCIADIAGAKSKNQYNNYGFYLSYRF